MGALVADTPIEMEKVQLRATAHEQRAKLGAEERAEAAKLAAAHLFSDVPISEDAIIACYWPIRDEIDCKPVLVHFMDAFRTVCLPVTLGDAEPLEFRVWEQGAQLYEAGFGSLAPAEGAPVVEPDVIIIPLLGFDKHGTRLGYGRGYYDRTVAVMKKKPVLIGYAFGAQELPEIPRDAHDVPMDYLVTETGVRRFKN
jgi:5-formyltetrahydrofolate cyclo-ligase